MHMHRRQPRWGVSGPVRNDRRRLDAHRYVLIFVEDLHLHRLLQALRLLALCWPLEDESNPIPRPAADQVRSRARSGVPGARKTVTRGSDSKGMGDASNLATSRQVIGGGPLLVPATPTCDSSLSSIHPLLPSPSTLAVSSGGIRYTFGFPPLLRDFREAVIVGNASGKQRCSASARGIVAPSLDCEAS